MHGLSTHHKALFKRPGMRSVSKDAAAVMLIRFCSSWNNWVFPGRLFRLSLSHAHSGLPPKEKPP